MAYTLGTAAAARGITSYAGALLAADAGLLRVPLAARSALQLDLPALAAVAALAALLAVGTRGSSAFNACINVANLAVILFVIVTGLPYFKAANFVPFMPMGVRGTIAGASKVRCHASSPMPTAISVPGPPVPGFTIPIRFRHLSAAIWSI